MKHIKPQSRPLYACVEKLDIEIDPCGGLTGFDLMKCRKRETLI